MAMDRAVAAAFSRLIDRLDGLWRRLRARSENTRLGSESRSAAASRGFKERTGKAAIGASDPCDGCRPDRIRQKSVTATFPHDFQKNGNAPTRDPERGHLRHRRTWPHALGEQLHRTRHICRAKFRFSPIFFGGFETRG